MQESSLARILAVLRARWVLVAVLGAAVLATGAWYAATRAAEHRSEAVLTFSPAPSAAADATFLRLVARYEVAAVAPDALAGAAAAAGLDAAAAADLGEDVTAEVVEDSLQLQLSVATSSPAATRVVSRELTDRVLGLAGRDPLVRAAVLVPPTPPEDASAFRRLVVAAVALLLAPAPGVAVAFVLEGATPRVRVREDVTALGLPVLLAVARRTLHRWEWGTVGARETDALPGLRTLLRAAAPARPGAPVVLTSPTADGAPDVDALAGALLAVERTAHEARVSAGAVPDGAADARGGPAVVALPGLLMSPAVPAAALGSGTCLLVLSTGTPLDRVRESVALLDRAGLRPAGAVLVR